MSKEVKDNKRLARNGLTFDDDDERIVHLPKFIKLMSNLLSWGIVKMFTLSSLDREKKKEKGFYHSFNWS